jgi:hypothetical protein
MGKNKFQNLLKYEKHSNPVAEQIRASEKLVEVVRESNLKLWLEAPHRNDMPHHLLNTKFSVLIVATWSNYDLWLLDLINEKLDTQLSPLHFYILDISDYLNLEDLKDEIPVISELYQTPIFVKYDSGWINKVASGKDAREAAGEFVGIDSKEISQLFDEYFKSFHSKVIFKNNEVENKNVFVKLSCPKDEVFITQNDWNNYVARLRKNRTVCHDKPEKFPCIVIVKNYEYPAINIASEVITHLFLYDFELL